MLRLALSREALSRFGPNQSGPGKVGISQVRLFQFMGYILDCFSCEVSHTLTIHPLPVISQYRLFNNKDPLLFEAGQVSLGTGGVIAISHLGNSKKKQEPLKWLKLSSKMS